MGLEAYSRGASHVLLVESEPRAGAVARENIAALGASGVRLLTGRVAQVLAAGPADGPYDVPDEEITAMLAALVGGGWLAADAVVVVERSSRSPEIAWVPGVTGLRGRRYGETTLWYGRRS